MRHLGWLVILACGCGESGGSPDLGVPRDLVMHPDQRMPGDMATIDQAMPDQAVADLAAALDLTVLPDFTVLDFARNLSDGAVGYKYVIRSLTLPQDHTVFAIDLNGDGKADNHLGDIISAVTALGFDSQGAIDQQVASGQSINLAELDTVDAALQNDPVAEAQLQAGLGMANPDYSGNGVFAIDNAQPPGRFTGTLQAAQFSSEDPITTTQPVTWTLSMPLLPGSAPIPFTLHGAHIQFTTGTDAASGAPGLLAGQINGSITQMDVQTRIIPQLAVTLTTYVALNPGSPQATQIEQIFDVGGCVDPNGMQAKANDMIISTCEVATNQIVANLLAPDVQIYDANGGYAPNKNNTTKDSLSVGVAFLAVRASW